MTTVSEATPRVNFSTMQRYVGKKVLLAVQVQQMQNGQVIAQTSDKGQVTIISNGTPFEGSFIEVLGTVTTSTTIQEEEHTNLSENFSKWYTHPLPSLQACILAPDASSSNRC